MFNLVHVIRTQNTIASKQRTTIHLDYAKSWENEIQ